jgi:hypothetical protein
VTAHDSPFRWRLPTWRGDELQESCATRSQPAAPAFADLGHLATPAPPTATRPQCLRRPSSLRPIAPATRAPAGSTHSTTCSCCSSLTIVSVCSCPGSICSRLRMRRRSRLALPRSAPWSIPSAWRPNMTEKGLCVVPQRR